MNLQDDTLPTNPRNAPLGRAGREVLLLLIMFKRACCDAFVVVVVVVVVVFVVVWFFLDFKEQIGVWCFLRHHVVFEDEEDNG